MILHITKNIYFTIKHFYYIIIKNKLYLRRESDYMYIDKRFIYVALAIMVLYGLSGFLRDSSSLLALLYSIPGVLVAITFHEYAHAKTADILGDDTPRREGRLSLNPTSHLDPIGFIMLIFAGFGWGKPVNVNPRNYNRDISMEKADSIVSIAGPIANFILAIIFTIIYFIIIKIMKINTYTNTVVAIIMRMIEYIILTNIGLGVFNLIPLPPLDGSKVIKPFLPENTKSWLDSNETLFSFLFVILWITGIAGNIITPIINVIFKSLMSVGTFFIGL